MFVVACPLMVTCGPTWPGYLSPSSMLSLGGGLCQEAQVPEGSAMEFLGPETSDCTCVPQFLF